MRIVHLSPILVLMMTACTAITEVTKAGNDYVQQSYSRHFWWSNWDRTVACPDLESNGYCPKGSPEVHMVTAMDAPGQKAAVGAAQQVPMAAGVGVGLSKMKGSTSNQAVTGGTQSQTNKNVPVFESPGSVVK